MDRTKMISLSAAPMFESRVLDGLPIVFEDWSDFNPDRPLSWVLVGVEGKWDGHFMGSFALNKAIFDQMVQANEKAGVETVVDYEHASVYGSSASPAAGWVKTLQRRNAEDGQNQLWAQVEWTKRASEYIRAKEYRYLSPTIIFNSRDRVTGKMSGARLHSVALTNTPFLHELPEVRLNSLRAALTNTYQEVDPMNREQYLALCSKLGLDPEKTTVEQVIDIVASQSTALAEVRQTLGTDDVVSASRELRARSTAADPTEVAALRAQVTMLQAQNQTRDAREVVREMQRLGKVQADGTDNHKACMDWACRDMAGFKTYMATIPNGAVSPIVNSPAVEGDPSRVALTSDDPTLAPEFALYAKQLGLTEDDIKKAKSAGII
jgi:phage I-like protein